MMELKCLVLATLLVGAAAAGPALAQAVGPATSSQPSDAQKATAVNSNTQSQVNSAVNFSLSAIGSVIQQGLIGRTMPGGQRAALAALGSDACGADFACAADPWGWSVWVQGGGGQSTNGLTVGGYNLGNYGTQAGVQAQITPKFLVGIGVSWQGTSGTLNGGFTSTSSVWGVTPYAGWQFDEHWNLSAMAGFSAGTTWLNNATTPPYNSAYQNNQWTFQGGLNGIYTVGNVFLAPNVTMTYVPTTTFGYTDSAGSFIAGRSTTLTRGSAGGVVGMSLAGGLQPYIRASIEHDFALPTGSEANGDTGGTVGAGANVPLTGNTWASIDGGYYSIGRTGLSLWSASLRLNLRF